MADYVAREWSNGDIITAANLNDIEQGVAGIDIDLGYSCTEEWVTLTDESVTTATGEEDTYPAATLSYSEPIEADTIKVTFNGVEYTCQKSEYGSYGAPWSGASLDWSEYPFSFGYDTDVDANQIYTETAGTYQVKIEAFEETIDTSECFKKAVKSVDGVMMLNYDDEENFISGATWQEAHEALASGTMLYLNNIGVDGQQIKPCVSYTATTIIFAAVTVNSLPRITQTAVMWNSEGTIAKRTTTYPSSN